MYNNFIKGHLYKHKLISVLNAVMHAKILSIKSANTLHMIADCQLLIMVINYYHTDRPFIQQCHRYWGLWFEYFLTR